MSKSDPKSGQHLMDNACSDLSEHNMSEATQALPAHCAVCSKSFSTISGLRRHMGRMHRHPSTPPTSEAELMETVDQIFMYPLSDAWTCAVCRDNFFNQQTLKRHQKRSPHQWLIFRLVQGRFSLRQRDWFVRLLVQSACRL